MLMENNILTIVLITIGSVGALGTFMYLVFAVRDLKDRLETLALEMVDFHTNYDNYQVEIERDLKEIQNSTEIRFDRVYRKMDKQSGDIYNHIKRIEKNLPDTIRKTIGHIEFARPLDNTFNKK